MTGPFSFRVADWTLLAALTGAVTAVTAVIGAGLDALTPTPPDPPEPPSWELLEREFDAAARVLCPLYVTEEKR